MNFISTAVVLPTIILGWRCCGVADCR